MPRIPDLLTADIILSYESTFASWAIRKATGSQWSHVGIYDGKGGFYSAVPFKGVCLQPLADLTKKAVCRVKNINDSQRQIVTELCSQSIGKKYDFCQVLLVGWRILTHRLNKNSGDPYPDKYECSEFVAEVFSKVGVNFGKIIDNVLPETIWSSPLVDRLE